MPVDFDGSADYVQFANNAIYDDLALKSVFCRTTVDGNGSDVNTRLLWKGAAAAPEAWSVGYNSTGDFFTFLQTSDATGSWATSGGSATVGNTYSIGASMDIGHIDNDPILYLDGVADTAEIIASVNAFDSDAGDGLYIGKTASGQNNGYYEGKVWDIHIANVIWTAEEFASLHASNAPGLWMRGLIFYAPMNGAAGLQEFDGAALGAANKVIDVISGILGTPTSNPLGVADTTIAA